MKIEHICLNAADIDMMKDFYVNLFGFIPNEKYHNDKTGWENYFLSSSMGGARLELLSHKDMKKSLVDRESTCIVHFSISLGSKEEVLRVTSKAKDLGMKILSEPRITGDGYYESSFLDPEGNMVELTV